MRLQGLLREEEWIGCHKHFTCTLHDTASGTRVGYVPCSDCSGCQTALAQYNHSEAGRSFFANSRTSWIILNCGLHDLAEQGLWSEDGVRSERAQPFMDYRRGLSSLLEFARSVGAQSTDTHLVFRYTTSSATSCSMANEMHLERLSNDRIAHLNRIADAVCHEHDVATWPSFDLSLSLGVDLSHRADNVHFWSRRSGLEPWRAMASPHHNATLHPTCRGPKPVVAWLFAQMALERICSGMSSGNQPKAETCQNIAEHEAAFMPSQGSALRFVQCRSMTECQGPILVSRRFGH